MYNSPWKRNLVMLWFSQILVMAGYAAMTPFIPLFIKSGLGIVNEKDLASYVAFYNFFSALAYCISIPIWGYLGDKYGIKPMLLRGTFVTAFIFPLMGYAKTPGMLIFLRFLTAACAGTTAASQTMIARNTPDDKQGFAQGVLTTAIWGGAMLGNVIGGFIIHYYNYLYAFWFCGILYFLAGIFVIFTNDDMKHMAVQKATSSTKSGFRFADISFSVWVISFLFLILGIIRNYELPYIALRIETIVPAKDADYWTGIISAIVSCGAIVSGVTAGYLTDKLKPAKLLIPLFLISTVALLLHCVDNLVVFTIGRTTLYIAAGGIPPVLQKALSAVTPPNKRGAAFGISSCLQNLGAMSAALLAGLSMSMFGINGVFISCAIIYFAVMPVFTFGINKSLKYGK